GTRDRRAGQPAAPAGWNTARGPVRGGRLPHQPRFLGDAGDAGGAEGCGPRPHRAGNLSPARVASVHLRGRAGAVSEARPSRPLTRGWRTASNRTTPAATETFRLSTWPAMGIETSTSHDSRTSRRSPVPSLPSTIATGTVQSYSSYGTGA